MSENKLSFGKKIFYTVFGIYLVLDGFWNIISFIGANFPILFCSDPGKWIIVREKAYLFFTSNLLFGLATLGIFYVAVMLFFYESKVKKYALIFLGIATVTALINSVAVLVLLDTFSPSWIRTVLNLVGFVFAFLI
jgi:hypothetical protein